jgi:predicted tellurium resistance membrane protein TerC
LRYGILGAFVLRTVAILFAKWVIDQIWVKLIGGLYLLYLPVKHFSRHAQEEQTDGPRAGTIFGLSLFWSTVVMVNLVDLVSCSRSTPSWPPWRCPTSCG